MCARYVVQPTRNNRGVAHENGSIEAAHGHLNTALAQALLRRGASDSDDLADYRRFIDEVIGRANARRRKLVEIERAVLRSLPTPFTRSSGQGAAGLLTVVRTSRPRPPLPTRRLGSFRGCQPEARGFSLTEPKHHRGVVHAHRRIGPQGLCHRGERRTDRDLPDLLFDDRTWKVRWLVVDTGNWLPGRQVLIHPSAIGQPDYQRQHLPVRLTKARVEASPDILQEQPVTMQMEDHLNDYYRCDPVWGPDFYGAGMGLRPVGAFQPRHRDDGDLLEAEAVRLGVDQGDSYLRSMTAIRGYLIHATDGSCGQIEGFLLDDATWTIRYLIVDTKNWWPGAHVLVSPYAVRSIEWSDHEVRLNVSRQQVKASPPWDPVDAIDQVYERRLHEHYGWPGYGR